MVSFTDIITEVDAYRNKTKKFVQVDTDIFINPAPNLSNSNYFILYELKNRGAFTQPAELRKFLESIEANAAKLNFKKDELDMNVAWMGFYGHLFLTAKDATKFKQGHPLFSYNLFDTWQVWVTGMGVMYSRYEKWGEMPKYYQERKKLVESISLERLIKP